ncbi:MAG: hypothetical protein PUC44_08040 [Eubacteriales bacterium]|nr:hypothetical protein [Eubacteriales bacterium]
MREIKLVPKIPFSNHMEVELFDYPDGLSGEERKRCDIDVDYTPEDIRNLKAAGMDCAAMKEYYRKEVLQMIRAMIGPDFEVAGGMEEVLSKIEEHLPV